MNIISVFKVVLSIAIFIVGGLFVLQGIEAYHEMPCKRTFNSFERVVYRQAYVIVEYHAALNRGAKFPPESVTVLHKYIDEQSHTADSLYMSICQFPEKMHVLKETAQKLNEESFKIRNHYYENFKSVKEGDKIGAGIIGVLRDSYDKVYDCTIIPIVEDNEMKNGTTLDLFFSLI